MEKKRQQILKEMAKLENLDSGDGGGDSDTGSKEGGKESGMTNTTVYTCMSFVCHLYVVIRAAVMKDPEIVLTFVHT